MTRILSIGCFDILHTGHLNHLSHAAMLGDHLTVAVYTDEVVEAYKGRQPIMSLKERIGVVAALRCVQYTVPLYERRFVKLLDNIRPDILVVGSSWGTLDIHKEAEALVKTIRIPYTEGISTSIIREKLC